MPAELLNHRFFDLKLHSDAELQGLLGCGIADRRTIHEWPLSCVQIVTTSDGRRRIYKSAYGPTVEARFYQRAESPLLPGATCLYRSRGYSILLIDYIQGTLVGDLHYSRDELIATGRSLVDQISRIRGNVPCYRDLGSVRRWQAFVARVLADLARLIDSGRFRLTTRKDAAYLREWVSRKAVLDQFRAGARTIHGDAIGNNVWLYRNSCG